MTIPTLSDDRIDSMRSSVMYAVDQDINHRGHRIRRTVGLIAASVLVIGFGSYGVQALDGGSSDSAGSAASSADRAAKATAPKAATDEDSASGDAKSVTPDDRQVVTTGEVSVTVKQPRVVAQKISTYVESIGGRVDTRSEDGAGDVASAFVTVRVPSSKVTTTIDRLKTYGTVEDVTLHNADVTAQAADLDARIKALQISIDRLETILADSATSSELIKAENALTQRQEQLESLQAQRTGIMDKVSLSTLSITLSQVPAVDSVEPDGFTGGLKDGWNALVSTINHVVEVAGVLLPWTAIVLLLCGAYRLVTRRSRSR